MSVTCSGTWYCHPVMEELKKREIFFSVNTVRVVESTENFFKWRRKTFQQFLCLIVLIVLFLVLVLIKMFSYFSLAVHTYLFLYMYVCVCVCAYVYIYIHTHKGRNKNGLFVGLLVFKN